MNNELFIFQQKKIGIWQGSVVYFEILYEN